MTMQATRQSQMASGTFEAEKLRDAASGSLPEAIAEAQRLASLIEELLAHREEGGADEGDAYGMRLARALAQSLIDQLAELSRDRKSPSSRLP